MASAAGFLTCAFAEVAGESKSFGLRTEEATLLIDGCSPSAVLASRSCGRLLLPFKSPFVPGPLGVASVDGSRFVTGLECSSALTTTGLLSLSLSVVLGAAAGANRGSKVREH